MVLDLGYGHHPSHPSHLSCVSSAIIKYSDKNQLRNEAFVLVHSSRAQCSMLVKSLCHRLRVAGHVTSVIKSQRAMDANVQLSFLFHTV